MRVVANIPPPSGFNDGRPWLDTVPVDWDWPENVAVDFDDMPVKFNGVTIGRITEAEASGDSIRVVADVLPEYRGLFDPPSEGFWIGQ